jgi:hypothetical protein
MSLLDTASLLLTPNAYKEGKLYSVIPSDGSGDFTFTRATTATRVNSDGLVELVPYNLVERSEEFNNAYWVKASSSVTANTATAPNGTMTADTVTLSSTTGRIEKVVSLTSNINYTLSVYAKNIDASNSRIGMLCINNANTICGVFFDIVGSGAINAASNATGVIESVGNGWYRCSMTFNSQSGATSPTIRIVNNAASGTGWTNGQSIYIWGAQLVEGTNALPYQKTETRLNIPRIDYSLGGCPNILLEPQRTNLLTYSNEFSNASWSKQDITVNSNFGISPDGTLNADKLTEGTGTAQHRISNIKTITSGVPYSVSCYVKRDIGTRDFAFISINSGSRVYFNLTNGTVGAEILGVGTIEDVGNGWYKCSATGTSTATSNTLYLAATNGNQGGSETYTGDGVSSLLIYGAQLEAGAYATSYIPTTTASVTRNRDELTQSNIYTNGLITASGGTWFVDFRNNVPLTRDAVVRFGLGDTSAISLNSIYFIGGASNGRLIIQKRVAGAVTTLYTTTADTCKIAFKWNGATMDIFENGFKVIADSVFTSTDLNFFNGVGQTPYFISSMLLAPTPLTDAECIQLTTL